MSELVWDIKNGELDSVKKEIENKGIDVNQEIDGRPLILYAADYGQVNMIDYLLSKGANPNVKLLSWRSEDRSLEVSDDF